MHYMIISLYRKTIPKLAILQLAMFDDTGRSWKCTKPHLLQQGELLGYWRAGGFVTMQVQAPIIIIYHVLY